MTERAEEYRRKAEECVTAAKTAAQLDVKNQYLELARQWQELATHIETIDRFKGNSL
jgi:hypothetical protein